MTAITNSTFHIFSREINFNAFESKEARARAIVGFLLLIQGQLQPRCHKHWSPSPLGQAYCTMLMPILVPSLFTTALLVTDGEEWQEIHEYKYKPIMFYKDIFTNQIYFKSEKKIQFLMA